MTPERWQQIDQLFEAALELEPGHRTALLEQKCGGDEELRREVESLLAAHKQSASFIEEPPSAAAAELLGNDPSESLVGQQIGRYKVLELLGAGGMGEVYLAEDTRLGRKVALKLLPARFAQEKDRLRRFEREARAASSLNHPNILTIFEIEQVDGRSFIVTEFIDGMTLREQMKRTRMEMNEKVDIAIQAASALSAAHEAGIVHRDVKPENIMLRRDGYVKVLDFGIAKLIEGPITEVDVGREETRGAVKTDTGVVIGTATYMSPEQARGLAVDARTDIWSLGVVLYELVAGDPPFTGETAMDVRLAIVNQEPERLEKRVPGLPQELVRIVEKALVKERVKRYQSARDMLIELKRLRQRLDAAPGRPLSPQSLRTTIAHHKLAAILASVFLVLAAAIVVFRPHRLIGGNQSKGDRAATSPSVKVTRLTSTGHPWAGIISPNGQYVTYHTEDLTGQRGLMLHQVATGSTVQIVPPAQAGYWPISFSRDGNYIYYYRSESDRPWELYQVPVLGGTPRKLIDDAPWNIVVSPDGKSIAYTRNHPGGQAELFVANAFDRSGERRLLTVRSSIWLPRHLAWSPDGQTIACVVPSFVGWDWEEAQLVAVRVGDGVETPITSHQWGMVNGIAWLADGSGLILAGRSSEATPNPRQLWHVSYPGGEIRRITNDWSDYINVSLTADSTALVTDRANSSIQVWTATKQDMGHPKQLTYPSSLPEVYWGFAWTPDDKIVYVSSASGNQDIWMMDADAGNPIQLTAEAGRNFDPVVTPDGRSIVFSSTRAGAINIWRMSIDGGNPTRLTHGDLDSLPSCTPDGRWVIYQAGPREDLDGLRLWKVSIDGGESVQLTDAYSTWPSVSPDGKWIACWYRQGGSMKAAVLPLEGGEPVKTFAIGPGVEVLAELRWTPDGRAVTYINNGGGVLNPWSQGVGNIWSQPLDGGLPKQVTDFRENVISRFEWSRDGTRLVCSRGSFANDIVLIRDFR